MDRDTHESRPKCGARNRKGAPCGLPSMDNGRCRFHGGLSTGPPEGNQNARTHGIYASALLEHEFQDYLGAKELKSLTEDLAMARIRLLRAERVHMGIELKLRKGERVDADELERSFRRCDALARTVGRLEVQQVRVLEVRDALEEFGELEARVERLVASRVQPTSQRPSPNPS